MKIELPAFEKARVLVVGDVMLDRYWHGESTRISPEAPVPVVNVTQTEERAGGAGNVAMNLASLGCHVTLLSRVGQDDAAQCLITLLEKQKIHCDFEQRPDLATLTKLRVLSQHQQLIRLDFEETNNNFDVNGIITRFKKHLSTTNVVVLSDYGKGLLNCVQELIAVANKANIPVLIDPKSNDFSIYRNATLITPNLKEFQAVVGHCNDEQELISKGTELLIQHNLQALLVTRSERGMTLLRNNHPALHLPTHAREVYDVTGAGDTVISVLAAALATKEDLATAATLANTAAGIVVSKLGAATVSVPELRRALQRQQDSELGILSEEELLIAVADARAHGERIIMTNGCFDILHAGHIHYLEEAKSLGDRLIVAVNDDASVQRLKGTARPINNLKQRMTMLSALRAVDWVVSFSEDTPQRIISHILPDVLVKGGDYQIDNIAGAKEVTANGGEIKILKFLEGHSSSGIIQKIRKEVLL